MKLYLIEQNEANGWDTYDSAVVAAESEEAARKTHPSDYRGEFYDDERNQWYSTGADGARYYQTYASDWAVSAEQVTARYLGDAVEGTEAGVIVSSFNAG